MRVLFCAAALSACTVDEVAVSSAPPLDSGIEPSSVIAESVALRPTELVEGVIMGGANDVALIQLRAPSSYIDWNIHGHPGDKTIVVYEEYARMEVEYELRPSAHGDWYLLIRNGGPIDMDVELRVALYGEMQWQWQ